MNNHELAALYARCFPNDCNHWKPEAIEQLRKDRHTEVITSEHGAVFLQIVEDEGELLSIFVDPDHQRRGEGSRLFNKLLNYAMSRGVRSIFLEVAADNQNALSFYKKQNFENIGKRKNYYKRKSGVSVDAMTMRCNL